MKIDLHIHSRDCSDGKMPLMEIFNEAVSRQISLISITDHDSIDCQETARELAFEHGIAYLTGVELNISFSHPQYLNSRPISLDMLGYQYDIYNQALNRKLHELRNFRKKRAEQILEKINHELITNHIEPFTHKDLAAIEETVDGSFGRPHIANYMVTKGIVPDRQTAFDRYLVKCNVPKMPVSLEEASELIRSAGGKLVFAHPNNIKGTSLAAFTKSINEQQQIIRDKMLPYLDGIECWHPNHDMQTAAAYERFAKHNGLIVTGGSDCHQQPVSIGTVEVPAYVAVQFNFQIK
ncbi:putative PHP domain protein [uncultured Desulfobacterium sp.]|uniref:Putative PHP domain protein n=1 Tax=uncultured Desulfobacterium sp. TaxID=201089 RepID=A0A445N1I5_9BACT|nr:putative PHP domain protein [uncultured Desulfobacterium sp.]